MDCIACQAPLSMKFSRQEYWSGLPCPLQGIFLTQRSNSSVLWLLNCRQILFCGANREVPVWMWELDHKEDWMLKNWCLWIVVLEKSLESPLDSKEINPVHPKENQPWIFTGKTDAETEAQILWLPGKKKKLSHWKRLWCWERLKAGGEGNNRGWDGWMASPTQWTWVWANSGR